LHFEISIIHSIFNRFRGAASSNGLKNRSLFPNAISAGYANLTPYQQIFISMMTSFQWKHVYVLYDDRSAIYAGAVAGMAAALRNLKDSQIYYKSVPCSRNSIADFTPLLEEFRQTARGKLSVDQKKISEKFQSLA
jgi:hypothetical protein